MIKTAYKILGRTVIFPVLFLLFVIMFCYYGIVDFGKGIRKSWKEPRR